jgi:hypothetical protein
MRTSTCQTMDPMTFDGCTQGAERGRLVLRYPDNPIISLNARFLDEVSAEEDSLIFEVDEQRAGLLIPQGMEEAGALVRQLAPYTRASPISDDETYEHTKAVLQACRSRRRYTGDFVTVGDDRVLVTEEHVYIGEFVCWISDVETYAAAARFLPLTNGHVHAAMVLLVIAQARRQESIDALAKRVWEYEARTRP